MMNTALSTPFADLLAPSVAGSTGTATAAAGVPAGEAGTAFNAILNTMLPAPDAMLIPATGTAAAAMPVTPPADLTAAEGEVLSLLLPALTQGEGTTVSGRDAEALPADLPDAETAAVATPEWLTALPLSAPLQAPAVPATAVVPPTGMSAPGLTSTLMRMPADRLSSRPAVGTVTEPVARPASGRVEAALANAFQALPLAAVDAASTAAAAPGVATLAITQGSQASGTVWTSAGQGLEGLLRSREGRLVQSLGSGGELSATSLSGVSTPLPVTMGGREPVSLSIAQHALQSPDWGDAFSQHLVTLAQQGTQSASIQLNPEELGPIHVRVSVHEQVASVEFAARHAATSELIESSLPRLAGALESHGLRLDDVKLSQLPARADGGGFSMASGGTQQGQQGGDPRGQQGRGGNAGADSGQVTAGSEPVLRHHVDVSGPDGVDAYA